MRTLKIFAQSFLIMMLWTGIGLAANPKPINPASECEKALYKQMHAVVTYPSFAQEQNIQGFVAISFSYDKSGNMQVIAVNSNDERLENYVISKMTKANVGSCVKEDDERIYNMRFDFQLK